MTIAFAKTYHLGRRGDAGLACDVLGVSALESTWGTSRFAAQGNNFFGIHYPAPYAIGYLQARRGLAKVAKFASYVDSLKFFVATSGSLIQAKSDPEAFAAALQTSGKFGIDPDTGAKVPTYVPKVAASPGQGRSGGICCCVAEQRQVWSLR